MLRRGLVQILSIIVFIALCIYINHLLLSSQLGRAQIFYDSASDHTLEDQPQNRQHKIELNWSKVATVIETRDSPVLIPVLQSWLANMPRDWPFVFWTGLENHRSLSTAVVFADEITSGRLNFSRIDIGDSPYRPDPRYTSTLSDLLGNSNWFWNQFHAEAEWMLFFQIDSVLCSKSDQTIDDWLGYEYLGAPTFWSHGAGLDRQGGNGGLSMRRISSARNLTTLDPRTREDGPEDVWFTRKYQSMNTTRWPELEGRKLSRFSMSQGWVEDLSLDTHWKPLGMHYGSGHFGEIFRPKPGGALTNQLQRIVQYCPEFLYLRFAVDEYSHVDMNEFRPGAVPQKVDASKEAEQDREIQELKLQLQFLLDSTNGSTNSSPPLSSEHMNATDG